MNVAIIILTSFKIVIENGKVGQFGYMCWLHPFRVLNIGGANFYLAMHTFGVRNVFFFIIRGSGEKIIDIKAVLNKMVWIGSSMDACNRDCAKGVNMFFGKMSRGLIAKEVHPKSWFYFKHAIVCYVMMLAGSYPLAMRGSIGFVLTFALFAVVVVVFVLNRLERKSEAKESDTLDDLSQCENNERVKMSLSEAWRIFKNVVIVFARTYAIFVVVWLVFSVFVERPFLSIIFESLAWSSAITAAILSAGCLWQD